MSDETLECLVSGYMGTEQPVYAFCWQGGEPTLIGVEFFRKVTELQKKYGRGGSVVSNSLQTNATLMDDELAGHLAEYKFLVGVSLDGPADMHDFYRKRAGGGGTHAAVLRGIESLRRSGVEFNVLTLVNSVNVKKPREVYRYFREMGIKYQQYIPCVECDAEGRPMPWSISGEEWGGFLQGVFDEWYSRDTRRVSVRHFDSILSLMLDGSQNVCQMSGNCCRYLLIEHNGDVYPCDFFVDEATRLGSIRVDSWQDLITSEKYRAFGRQKSSWNKRCSRCKYLGYCMGDCLKHRIADCSDLSRLCVGWKQFFEQALPRLNEIASMIRMERMRSESPSMEISRNAPCPCGSGKKYKRCHGA